MTGFHNTCLCFPCCGNHTTIKGYAPSASPKCGTRTGFRTETYDFNAVHFFFFSENKTSIYFSPLPDLHNSSSESGGKTTHTVNKSPLTACETECI